MDGETQERVIRFLASIAFAGMVMIFAFLVVDARPYAYAALGTIMGQVLGGEIATRTAKQTRKKIEQESMRPPSGDDEGGGTTLASISEPPQPRMPRRDRNRSLAVALATFALTLFGIACAASNPMATIYGAEGVACVERFDSAAEARACMREVDRRYGQDGGLANDR